MALHVVAVQGASAVGAHDADRRQCAVIAEEIDALAGIGGIGGQKIDVAETSARIRLLAGVAGGAVVGEDLLAPLHRARAVFLVKLFGEFVAALQAARGPQVGGR